MKNKGLLYSIITRKKAAFAVILILFILGGICFKITPKQQFPVIQLPVVIITATYPGASPSDMEELVTDKIEDVCFESEGFNYVKSDSYNGVSVVRMMFDREMSDKELNDAIDSLRTDIDELRENELPEGVTSLTFNDNAFETCGIILAFTGEQKTNEELVRRAEDLKDIIQGTDGVVRTEVEGELEERIKITVDRAKADAIPVTLSELSSVIAYQNSVIPVGTVEFDNNEMYINSSGKFADIDEIKDIIIYENAENGAAVRLRDIADVQTESDPDGKRYSFNGEDASVLSIYFDESANIIDVSNRVMDMIDDYSAKIPSDIKINKVVCLSDDVNSSINEFILNLIESVLIVLIIIMLGMSIRNGSLVAFVIPFTIFLTFIAMRVFGIDVQFVSLASLIIALGMLVDNAIVVSDAIQVRLDGGEDRMSACLNGTREVALPVFSSMLTTVVIFCIFYNLPGTMRRFVFSLPTIVIAALVFSYISSMLVTPLMCYIFMKPSENNVKKRKSDLIRRIFSDMLSYSLKKPLPAMLLSVLCVAAGIALLSSRDLQLMPYSDKMFLDINIETDNMFYLKNTQKAVEAAIDTVKNEDCIDYFLASSGGRVPKYDFTTMASSDAANLGSIVVKLKDTGSMSKGEYCKYLENKLKTVTSANITVKEIGIIPKPSEEIQLSVCGSSIQSINDAASEAADLLRSDPETRDVYADIKVKDYTYYIDMKNDRLNSSGLTKGEVQNELNIAMMGRTVTSYRKDGKEYPVILQSNADSIGDMKDLTVKSSVTGSKYKLSQIADIGLEADYSKISHHNGMRCVTVTALPEDGKSAVVIENRLRRKLDKADLGDVEVVYEGDVDTFDEIITALLTGGIIGVIAILLILYLQFYSLKRCFIIFLTVPFALVGSSVGLTVFGENLSMFAILGIISLIGVVVNNAIVLVDYIDGELEQGADVKDACAAAVDKRFRPILLSSGTTILGLVPLAFTGNVLFRGLSIAFMCGLFASLVFTLVIIPTVYSMIINGLPDRG